ncbi:MAG: hypothetical protein ACYSUI_09330 [Planctomycetota bacterium]|jgi:prepilin-type processing-associated H-X9-DG protein
MARESRHGITLIELVVAASAFMLLAAMLAPALADARRRGKDTLCLQNLARIAQASIVYAAADADEQAIPTHPRVHDPQIDASRRRAIPAYAWGGKSGHGKEGSDPLFWGTGRGKGPATRPLNEILYGDVFPDYSLNPGPGFANWKNDERLDLSVYRCPSDSGYTGPHYTSFKNSGLTSYDHYGHSYAANVLWMFTAGTGNCGGPCCMSLSPYLRALSDIVNPVETVYYLENCGRYAYLADPQGYGCGPGPYPDAVVHGWHGLDWIFNVAFVDGHVAPVKMKGYQNPHLGRYPVGDYSYWHCVIIRGDNWQFDTLPLEPVVSTISCGAARERCKEGDGTGGAQASIPDLR